tara:strand:+ start:118 stop:1101 length:984 start_codon:yes stop_codon:yes gene_type:complete
MSTFVPFSSPCDVVDIAPYKKLKLEYRTVDVVGVKNLKVSSIQFKNDKGQVINLARSIGTDKENVRLLRDSFLNQGWDISKTPPIVEESNFSLYDGFSRHEALLERDQETAPYLVVRRKKAYSAEDVIDEIGLGANNHSQSKKATISDFKKRFIAYVIRQKENGRDVTTNDGIQWFASIPNSFSEKQIEDTIENAFKELLAALSMEAFTKGEAEEKGAELLGIPKKKVFAYCKRGEGQNHYKKRMIGDILDYFDKHGDVPSVVGFLARTEAEDADEKRQAIYEEVEQINRMMAGLGALYKRDPGYNFIDLKGYLPQVIDKESELIKK